jgi:hypothetical protein
MRTLFPLIAAIGALALLIGSMKRISKKRNIGWTMLFAGLMTVTWSLLEIVPIQFDQDSPATRHHFDHYTSMIEGSALTLLVLLLIQAYREKNDKK